MVKFTTALTFALIQAGVAVAVPLAARAPPTVKLDQGTFTGMSTGSTSRFLGIPYALPPVGNLRFNLPQPNQPYTGAHNAASFGLSCPQQAVKLPIPAGLAADAVNWLVNSIYNIVIPDSEDCLTINVVTPSNAKPGSKLPVAVWIFGGGFELGGTSIYDGSVIVDRSIDLGEPVIYVSMNYRVSGFGFLASKEVKDAGVGNLGLQDQRQALRWIQKYISSFGGDPSKVTIWGESAGAISVALQMVTNGGNTEGLFRGAFMESGSPVPVGDISHGQAYYDAVVQATGCAGQSDTLGCLRGVPYDTLKDAIDQSPGIFSYQSLALAWLPRTDGVFLTDTPQNLVASGSVANIPMISGDCDDEGTLFSLSTLNISTTSQLENYVTTTLLPGSSLSDAKQLFELYPDDITQGSPFDTGLLNALSPQFKRIAAFLGDAVFQAPRRYFLQNRSGKQEIWSFLSKRLKGLPVLGSVHASDLVNVYGGGEMQDYLINFVNNLDPNGAGGHLQWPQWTTGSPNMMTFLDGFIPLTITQDTYRQEGMEFLTQFTLKNPI